MIKNSFSGLWRCTHANTTQCLTGQLWTVSVSRVKVKTDLDHKKESCQSTYDKTPFNSSWDKSAMCAGLDRSNFGGFKHNINLGGHMNQIATYG